MEFTLFTILSLILLATVCEFIDSSMGMLYGTILSPLLIIVGFNPLLVVPSILFSQAFGGLVASFFHNRLKNVEFGLKIRSPKVVLGSVKDSGLFETLRRGISEDLRATLCLSVLGVIVTITAALIAINISKIALKTYIGILILIMGIILLSRLNFQYTWKRILGISVLSAFNKGISGGGFGPVTTAGQIIAGRKSKSSIGATTLAEGPICIVGFLTYLFTNRLDSWSLLTCLTVGAIIGAIIGPHFTVKFKDDKKLRKTLGMLVAVLGIWTLLKAWFL